MPHSCGTEPSERRQEDSVPHGRMARSVKSLICQRLSIRWNQGAWHGTPAVREKSFPCHGTFGGARTGLRMFHNAKPQ